MCVISSFVLVYLTSVVLFFCRYNKLGLDTPDNELNDTVYTFMEVKNPVLTGVQVNIFSLGTHHSSLVTSKSQLLKSFRSANFTGCTSHGLVLQYRSYF